MGHKPEDWDRNAERKLTLLILTFLLLGLVLVAVVVLPVIIFYKVPFYPMILLFGIVLAAFGLYGSRRFR